MRLDRISTDDIVEARVRGRVILGRVTEISDGIVHFDPISRSAGWRHAKAREIVAHWRKTGRRSTSPEDPDERATLTHEQLPADVGDVAAHEAPPAPESGSSTSDPQE